MRQQSGYTLVEVLVAMGVGALLLSAVLAAFLSCSRLLSWIGTRTDVASAALLGLSALSNDMRESAFATLTIDNSPPPGMSPALAFRTEDPSVHDLSTFLPVNYFTLYYFDANNQVLVRKQWNGTQPGSLLPDPFQVGRLSGLQVQQVLAQTNGTEHVVAANVVSVTVTPATYPTTVVVSGIQVSLMVHKTAPSGAQCVETVTSMTTPRNHP